MYEVFISLGIVVSLIYNEITDLSPGGLISPGYLALFMNQPDRVFATVVVALLTYLITQGLIKVLPIYGKRQFATAVTIAIVIKLLVSSYQVDVFDSTVTVHSIGVIVPGLIANDMIKQGKLKTLTSLGVVSFFMTGALLLMRNVL